MGLRFGLKARRAFWAYVFITPALVFFVLIVLYPVFRALQMSLYRWPLGAPQKTFLGLANYVELFHDRVFVKSLFNTFWYTLGTVPATLVLALGLALLLNMKLLKGRSLFRTVYFVPVVSSVVAVSFVWRWLLEPSFGLINYGLRLFHLPAPGWLASTTWAMPGIMLVGIWRELGFYMVIFLAGLQTIPQELYEAATVDGANWKQCFWKITLPLLNPSLVFAAVIAVINGLQMFTQVYVMTGGGTKVPGGPLHSTRTIVLHIVQAAFRSREMGYASAAAFVLFMIIFVLKNPNKSQ
ncbi:MAG TPA: sugar ABC transporter permease [Anaerolineae bacterium]|nr:sugar ABC transporter permease [Anaerolineae bacterium]